MNPALAQHLIDFLRREKPTLRELPIPAYVERLLEEIESAGFSVRKKPSTFKPSGNVLDKYLAKVETFKAQFDASKWREGFPLVDIEGELIKACLWLKAKAKSGDYRSNLEIFFHNWLSKAKPSSHSQGAQQPPANLVSLSDARDAAIAQGIHDLAASRSENVYPKEFEFRFSVAKRDLTEIPTEHLDEVFRRARLTEIRGTPGVYHVLEAWKKLKADLREAKAQREKELKDKQAREEEAQWAQLTPEERAAEASRTLQKLTRPHV